MSRNNHNNVLPRQRTLSYKTSEINNNNNSNSNDPHTNLTFVNNVSPRPVVTAGATQNQ